MRKKAWVPLENGSELELLHVLRRDKHIHSESVLNALSRVSREEFVPEQYRQFAYENRALPIEESQTISQPFIVAFMTQEAKINSGHKVLEIGTGSGYQAAILAELGAEVYSVEIRPELAESASKRLAKLGYDVHTKLADGWEGWAEAAPFDSILVTAAAPSVPPKLLEQLGEGGRMIIPLTEGNSGEILVRIDKVGGKYKQTRLIPVRFVPFVGGPPPESD